MSPEQAKGKAHEADARSDVYSLGVILYELLTGELPFRGDKSMLIMQIINDEPASPRKLAPIPRNLETICLKCLRKDADRRYESAKELADDLRRATNNEPIKARPVGSIEKAWLWCRRRPAIAGMMALVVGVVAISSVVVLAERRRSQIRTTKTAVDTLQNSRGLALPFAIKDLTRLPKSLVLRELNSRFDGGDNTRQYLIACALAEFGTIRHEVIIRRIASAHTEECENIVIALSRGEDLTPVFAALTETAKAADAKKDWKLKSRLAIVALHIGDASIAQDIHRIDRQDPTQQTIFIHDVFPNWHGDLSRLATKIQGVKADSLLAGICLSLGKLTDLGNDRRTWAELMSEWYVASSDSGTHGAAGWALGQLKITVRKKPPIETTNPQGRDWRVTPRGLTMVRIGPGQFARRVHKRKGRLVITTGQTVTLTREFWLSNAEVSVGLFKQFVNDRTYKGKKPKKWNGVNKRISPSPEHPVQRVNWVDAVLFCNWLSLSEGLRPCYKTEPLAQPPKTPYAEILQAQVKLLPAANGYRLPTEAEWEYACRAGSTTAYFFGSDQERLTEYAVFSANKTEVLGSKMCNRWGLFDVHGNVREWCYDWHNPAGEVSSVDPIGALEGHNRVYRGGSFSDVASSCQSASLASRLWGSPGNRLIVGFRVAQGPLRKPSKK